MLDKFKPIVDVQDSEDNRRIAIDEKYATEYACEHPRFVEDMVCDVAACLNAKPRSVDYVIESENFKSIHNHSAYALVTPARGK
jgi:GTP cyclohydrolase FolE2